MSSFQNLPTIILRSAHSKWVLTVKSSLNEEKSAASFCRQVAALFPDMLSNYFKVKIHKIAKNSTTTHAKEKIRIDLESLDF